MTNFRGRDRYLYMNVPSISFVLFLGSTRGQDYVKRAEGIVRELALKGGCLTKFLHAGNLCEGIECTVCTLYAGQTLPIAITLLAIQKCSRLRTDTRSMADLALSDMSALLSEEVRRETRA